MEISNINPKILSEVYSEFNSLLSGKDSNLTMAETQELKDYARARTNIEIAENELNDEQKSWKYIYLSIDEQMGKNLDIEEKKKIDHLSNKYYSDSKIINNFKEIFNQFEPNAKEVENLLKQQWMYIATNWDESSGYKEKNEMFSKAMLDPSLSKSERLEHAQTVLRLVEIHSESIGEPLRKVNQNIHQALAEIKEKLNSLNSLSIDSKIQNFFIDYPQINEALNGINKWFDAANKVYLNRRVEANYVHSQEKWDRDIPNKIIQEQGDIDFTMPKSYVEEIAKAAIECKEAQNQEQSLTLELETISSSLFGKDEEEGENKNALSDNIQPQQLQPTVVTGKFKGVFISLCVVLVGIIFVGLGANIFGYVIVIFAVIYGTKIIWKN